MKRNKSSKTAFDLMRHYELKTFLQGIVTLLHLDPLFCTNEQCTASLAFSVRL